jgi:hypothetical protein
VLRLSWLWNVISRLRGRCQAGICLSIRAPAEGLRTSVATSSQPDGADLLYRRMETLHLDWHQFAQFDPTTLTELQRLCIKCKSRGACALDLAHPSADAAWGEWREYCPNATKLNEMRVRRAMQFNPPFLKS